MVKGLVVVFVHDVLRVESYHGEEIVGVGLAYFKQVGGVLQTNAGDKDFFHSCLLCPLYDVFNVFGKFWSINMCMGVYHPFLIFSAKQAVGECTKFCFLGFIHFHLVEALERQGEQFLDFLLGKFVDAQYIIYMCNCFDFFC